MFTGILPTKPVLQLVKFTVVLVCGCAWTEIYALICSDLMLQLLTMQ